MQFQYNFFQSYKITVISNSNALNSIIAHVSGIMLLVQTSIIVKYTKNHIKISWPSDLKNMLQSVELCYFNMIFSIFLICVISDSDDLNCIIAWVKTMFKLHWQVIWRTSIKKVLSYAISVWIFESFKITFISDINALNSIMACVNEIMLLLLPSLIGK